MSKRPMEKIKPKQGEGSPRFVGQKNKGKKKTDACHPKEPPQPAQTVPGVHERPGVGGHNNVVGGLEGEKKRERTIGREPADNTDRKDQLSLQEVSFIS